MVNKIQAWLKGRGFILYCPRRKWVEFVTQTILNIWAVSQLFLCLSILRAAELYLQSNCDCPSCDSTHRFILGQQSGGALKCELSLLFLFSTWIFG